MESVKKPENPEERQKRGAKANLETGRGNVQELRQNRREGEHAEVKSSGMGIPHEPKREEKDKYIQPLIDEGERVKAIFA